MTRKKKPATFVKKKTAMSNTNGNGKKEEIQRKSFDLEASIWKALKLDAIKKDFKNLKKYCESILRDAAKK